MPPGSLGHATRRCLVRAVQVTEHVVSALDGGRARAPTSRSRRSVAIRHTPGAHARGLWRSRRSTERPTSPARRSYGGAGPVSASSPCSASRAGPWAAIAPHCSGTRPRATVPTSSSCRIPSPVRDPADGNRRSGAGRADFEQRGRLAHSEPQRPCSHSRHRTGRPVNRSMNG